MKPEPKKKEWPKWAVGPLGNRARFDGPGDVPVGWTLEGQSEPLHKPTVRAPEEQVDDEHAAALAELRAAYAEKFGKKPGPKWDIQTLRDRLAE